MTNSLTLKKAIVAAVAVATVLATAGLSAFAPMQASAAEYGDLIMGETLSTVYYYGSDGQRYSFPNEKTFFSWYDSFDGVVEITDEELADITLAGNIVYRPGSRWIKIESDEKVYAVSTDGSIHWVEDEDTAEGLAGEDWNTFIDDVPDVFFVDYTVGDSLSDASAGYDGMLWTDGTDNYLVWDGELRMLADLEDNGYQESFVLSGTGFDSSSLTAGDDIDSELAYLTDTAQMVEDDTYSETEEITVSVSDDSPSASTLVAGQGVAHLVSLDFVNSSSSDATVTSLALDRSGVSADTTLSNAYLFDGWARVSDSATVSSGTMTWNDTSGLFVIPANSTYTVDVRSDIASSTSGQTVGVELVEVDDIAFDGSFEASGSFPLESDTHTIASVSTFGTVAFGATSLPSSDGAPEPQDDFRGWESTVTVGNNEAWLTAFSIRNVGSVNAEDVENYRLYVSGVHYGDAVDSQDSDGYISFDFSDDPVEMNTGNHQVKVLADIVGGSTRTLQLNLRKTADAIFIEDDYDQPILVTLPTTVAAAQTIASGAISFTKASDSPADEVTENSSNTVLGRWDVKATGEAMKVEDLNFYYDSSDNDIATLRNGAVYLDDSQIGSTTTLQEVDTGTAYTSYTFGSSFIVYPGSPVSLELRADIYDNDGTDSIDGSETLTAYIDNTASSNVERMTSGGYLSRPSSDVSANTVTIQNATLTAYVNSAYANQSVVAPKTAYKVGSWTLSAGSSEDINLNTLEVDFDNGTNSFTSISELTNLYIEYGPEDDMTTTTTKSTAVAASNSWSLDYTLEAGETIYVNAYVDLASAMTASDVILPELDYSGIAAESATTVSGTDTAGQTITLASGSFAVTVDGSSPVAAVYSADQTIEAGVVRFTSTNEDYYIDDMTVSIGSGAVGVATSVSLYDGDDLLDTEVFDETSGTRATFTNLNHLVASNTYELLTVKLGLSEVGTGGGSSQQNVAVTLVDVDYNDSQGVDQTNITSFTDATTNEARVYASYPTVTHTDLTNSTIVNGQAIDVYKFSVTADSAGAVAIKQLSFPVSYTDVDTDTMYMESWKLYKNGTDISSNDANIDIIDEDGDDIEATGNNLTESDTHVRVSWDASEEVISAGETVTYTLRATPQGFDSDGDTGEEDYFTIYLAGDSSHNGDNVCLSDVNDGGTEEWELDELTSGSCATDDTGTPTAYNFIWSDNSGSSHNGGTETGSGDWANGYLILNLDLDGETWYK